MRRTDPARTDRPSWAATSNGQGLNLNRDYVKMEAPETRGAAALLDAWDPDVFIDLHTTNGSYHGYALTYAPGLNPNGNPARDYVRDRLLPLVRERMRRRHDTATFWYGNFRNQDPDSLAAGWETYDPRPRFGTNWMGLRGKMAMLSEGYSNADFRTRVTATYDFVREVLSAVAEQRAAVLAAVEASLHRTSDSVTVRSVLGPPTTAGRGGRDHAPRTARATVVTPGGLAAGSIGRSACRCSTVSWPPAVRRSRSATCCHPGSATWPR